MLFFKLIVRYLISVFEPNIEIHHTAKVSRKAVLRILNGGSIKIGKNTEILDYAVLITYGGHIELGDNCSVNPFTVLYGHGNLKIGDNVMIAGGCMVIPFSHVIDNRQIPINQQGITKLGIVIEDDVWIGHGCSILDGVIIKRGSIVGAGSVVTKDIEEYTINLGMPSKLVRYR